VAPGEVVVADREVTYYAGSLHYVDSERLMALAGDTDDVSRLPVGRARWIASRHPRVAALLPAGAAQVAAFGDYRIWAIPAATAGP
jgi:hypothetical protein